MPPKDFEEMKDLFNCAGMMIFMDGKEIKASLDSDINIDTAFPANKKEKMPDGFEFEMNVTFKGTGPRWRMKERALKLIGEKTMLTHELKKHQPNEISLIAQEC